MMMTLWSDLGRIIAISEKIQSIEISPTRCKQMTVNIWHVTLLALESIQCCPNFTSSRHGQIMEVKVWHFENARASWNMQVIQHCDGLPDEKCAQL